MPMGCTYRFFGFSMSYLFLTSPCLFCTYQLCFLFPIPFPALSPSSSPSGADSWVNGFVYILGPCASLQQTLQWDWEFFLPPQPPQIFYGQRFWGFISLCWNPGLHHLSHFPVVPPGLSSRECGTSRSDSCHLSHLVHQLLPCHTSPLPQLPISTPLSSLYECLFFNSLVVGLPYSLIFWLLWLVFVFKLVVVLYFVVLRSKAYLSTPLSWLEVFS